MLSDLDQNYVRLDSLLDQLVNLVEFWVIFQFVFDLKRKLCFARFDLLFNFFVNSINFIHNSRLLAHCHLRTFLVHPVRDRKVLLDCFLGREKHLLVCVVLSLAIDLYKWLNVLYFVVQAFWRLELRDTGQVLDCSHHVLNRWVDRQVSSFGPSVQGLDIVRV